MRRCLETTGTDFSKVRQKLYNYNVEIRVGDSHKQNKIFD